MTEQDKKDIIHLFNEGFEQVVLPHIVEMKEDITGMKKELSDVKTEQSSMRAEQSSMKEQQSSMKQDIRDIKETVGRIERRQEAEQTMLDNHDVRLTRLEKTIFAK